MTSQAIRDPLADHLITPQNSAFLLIDWQPTQISTVRSTDQDLLLRNAVSTVRTVKAYGVPVVHSTVNVASGQQQPTVPELAELVQDDEPLDRTDDELVGRRPVRRCCSGDRPTKTHPLRPVDRDLHGVRGP